MIGAWCLLGWVGWWSLIGQAGLVLTDDMLRLANGSGSIRVIVRNTTLRNWSGLKLTVLPEAPLAVVVTPERIQACQPGDRCVFRIDAQSQPTTPQRRFAARLWLAAGDGTEVLQAPLWVDASARAKDRERGWMDAGSIAVGSGSHTTRVLVLALLSAVPVALLLVLGWWLRRRAKRPAD